MKDRRLSLLVVGAAAITALAVAEPKVDESWVEETQTATVHVHTKRSIEPCMADDVMIAAKPAQPAREQAC